MERRVAAMFVVIMCLMFQCTMAAATTSRSCGNNNPLCECDLKVFIKGRTRKLMEEDDDYSGGGGDDYYDNNDGFYRRQGDVPSPGIGH